MKTTSPRLGSHCTPPRLRDADDTARSAPPAAARDALRLAIRRGALVAALMGATLALCAGALAPAAGATPVAKSALINGDSVLASDGFEKEGTPISLEQHAAEAAGFTVTVVSGQEWAEMSASDFANYSVLIIGDPSCGTAPGSALESAPRWTAAVMGTSGSNRRVGNRVLVGTDPEYHYPEHNGAEHLVQDGIAYAGEAEGATGVYFDASCDDPEELEVTSILDHLTVEGPGHWSANMNVPCGGSVSQAASIPAFETGESKLQDGDIEGWECSVHQTYPEFPSDWYAVALATDTESKPTCGVDPESKEEVCGQAYVLAAGSSIVAEAPNVKVTPAEGSDPAGGSHSLTATVERGGPLKGVAVTFVVTGQNAGVRGSCTTPGGAADPECLTDENGEVVFTYADAEKAGTDTINASITLGEATEHATAAETWTPRPAPLVTEEPTISGASTPAEGTSLTANPGQFSEAEELTYQWQVCTSEEVSSCADIMGATGTQYTPESGQVNEYLRFVVTATGEGGSVTSASALAGPVKAAPAHTSTPTSSPSTTTTTTKTTTKKNTLALVPLPCTSKRVETIHWTVGKHVHLGHVTVLVNGAVHVTLPGSARSATISLLGMSKGTVHVEIDATGRHGRRYSSVRAYHPCVTGVHHSMKSIALKG
jgi:hypothetical protein